MSHEDLSKEISLKITLGHLILAWEVISSKFSDLRSNENLSEEERRAIWALADLMEYSLIDNEIDQRPLAEWETLINRTKEFIKTIPADFLD